MEKPRRAGLLGSRPVSRILSRVPSICAATRLLGGPRRRSLFALHRTGFDEPALSPGPLVGSYPTVSPLPAATPEIRDRRSVFCVTFRRLSPPPWCWSTLLLVNAAGASCPAVSGLSSTPAPAEGGAPRSPGLRLRLYPRPGTADSPVQTHRTLGAAHEGALVENELTADRALERCSAQHGEELLLERAVELRRRIHNSRNTPTTLPRISTCRA